MLNLLLFAALVAGHPPRIQQYPWRLMVGHPTQHGIVWDRTDQSFLEPQDCAEETKNFRIAECVRDPQYA